MSIYWSVYEEVLWLAQRSLMDLRDGFVGELMDSFKVQRVNLQSFSVIGVIHFNLIGSTLRVSYLNSNKVVIKC